MVGVELIITFEPSNSCPIFLKGGEFYNILVRCYQYD